MASGVAEDVRQDFAGSVDDRRLLVKVGSGRHESRDREDPLYAVERTESLLEHARTRNVRPVQPRVVSGGETVVAGLSLPGFASAKQTPESQSAFLYVLSRECACKRLR